jgi:type IV secretion system protein VirB5
MNLFRLRNGSEQATAPKNPYARSMSAWDNVNGFAIARMKRSDLYAMIFAFTTVVFAIGMVYYANQPRLVPYVVEVDKLNQSLAVSHAQALADLAQDPALTRSVVQNFVENIRTVTFDQKQEKILIADRVRPFVATGSPAEQIITTWLQANNPFDRMKQYSISVEADSPLALSSNTFQVDWQETKTDIHGDDLGVTHWRGVFTVATNYTSDEAQLMLNPAGIYVTNISWNQQRVNQ